MAETKWRIPVGEAETSAIADDAPADAPVFVCAHGAGGNMHDRGTFTAARTLRDAGLRVVRFNFLYTEAKSRRPDPMPRLQDCFAAVVERVRRELAPARLIIGGRSMGGRVASMMAADGLACDGLLLLAYPLHPAGQPEKLRDAHLPRIAVPTLCVNGTRDALCRRDLMEEVLTRVQPSFRMRWLEGADHSFHVLRSSGRTDADVQAELRAAAAEWLDSIG
jgi:predicted alpha/beta-hydrolase family hydrolase